MEQLRLEMMRFQMRDTEERQFGEQFTSLSHESWVMVIGPNSIGQMVCHTSRETAATCARCTGAQAAVQTNETALKKKATTRN